MTIRDFRGIRNVSLDGFSRVNIIVGDNGSGKTSLLEAIFIAMSNSALLAVALRQFRGLASNLNPDHPSVVEAIASDFFSEGVQEVYVEARMADRAQRTFTAKYDPKRTASLGSVSLAAGIAPTNVFSVPVVYRWEDSDGEYEESELYFGPSFNARGSGSIDVIETRYLPSTYVGQGGTAALFSDMDKAGEALYFTDAMRAQFPELEAVSVQLEGGQPLLHARLKGQRRQRPLELHSGGLARLSVILLLISRPTTKIVLVDEIENGFHHKRFDLLWRQIREFCVRSNTQVFITTHSLECLDAAADAMAEHPDDFALLRAARFEGNCVVGILPGAKARQLLRSGLEVRG
jgi:predicted ATPase